MTSEAYSSAGRAAGRYARVLLGRTAGTSLGLGLAGAVGSTVLYETALTPLGSHDKLKGFHESTLNVYSTAALTVAAAEKNVKAEQAEEALQPAPAEKRPRQSAAVHAGEARPEPSLRDGPADSDSRRSQGPDRGCDRRAALAAAGAARQCQRSGAAATAEPECRSLLSHRVTFGRVH